MDHHYYASTVYGWATAPTRDEAIKKVARAVGVSMMKQHRPAGVLTVVCRVDLPEVAHYSINEYIPNKINKEDGVNELRKGETVPIGDLEYVRITSLSGNHRPAEK